MRIVQLEIFVGDVPRTGSGKNSSKTERPRAIRGVARFASTLTIAHQGSRTVTLFIGKYFDLPPYPEAIGTH
jgi:hypothetical protein